MFLLRHWVKLRKPYIDHIDPYNDYENLKQFSNNNPIYVKARDLGDLGFGIQDQWLNVRGPNTLNPKTPQP